MVGQAFLSLATAFGLSTSAGLNAYIPLLIVALLARFTSLVTLNEPWDALSSWWVACRRHRQRHHPDLRDRWWRPRRQEWPTQS